VAEKKKSSKAGRNRDKAALYKATGRREANKARKAEARARRLAKAAANRERREAEANSRRWDWVAW
jgi:hypothetical protein